MYTEAYRNQLHFSPPANWMNDPNGMVYFEGAYHLFYQYHPASSVWGPMHWGHAVSKDLMHWTHLPVALSPDDLGYIFSGSVVMDWDNTSGLGLDGESPLVAIFTHHDAVRKEAGKSDYEVQSLAYSQDKGSTWIKYEDNPVLPNTAQIKDFRDPKVLWDDARGAWLMVLAVKDRVHFYGSKNLLEWTFLSEWGTAYGDRKGVWECPDFFPMIVEDGEAQKWVLLLSLNPGGPNGGSGTQYFVGDFDGKNFILDPEFVEDIEEGEGVWIDFGPDNYAGVTWSDIPDSDNRRLFMAWMSNWAYAQEVPTTSWRSAMSMPRSLSLHHTEWGYRLRSNIVKEIAKIAYGDRRILPIGVLEKETLLFDDMEGGLFRLQLKLTKEGGPIFGVKFSNAKGEYIVLGYDGITNNYFIDRSNTDETEFQEDFSEMSFAPIFYEADFVELDVLIDIGAIEVFADGGSLCMSSTFFAQLPMTRVDLVLGSGSAELLEASVQPLQSIW